MYSLIDAKVECGKVFRYHITQHIGDDRIANDLKVGEVLPKYNHPEIENPCDCKVTEIARIP
jgi:hypothetical protein